MLLALLFAVATDAATDGNRFVSAAVGLSVVKPASWHFISAERAAELRRNTRLSDEELQKAVEAGRDPIVTVMKHPYPYIGLNPTFYVLLRPRPEFFRSSTPKEILATILPGMRRGTPDFELDREIRGFELSGLPAADWIARYTVTSTTGDRYRARGRLVVVTRGKMMFMITLSAPESGPDSSTAELEQILRTMSIDK